MSPAARVHRNPIRLITTPRLHVRGFRAGDASLMKDAIDDSLEHLRPVLEWARKPTTVEEVGERLQRFAELYAAGMRMPMGIFDPDEREVLGGIGLRRTVGEGGLEMGYWIRAARTGEGLATEAAAALTRMAFEHLGARFVEIQCEPQNARSSAVARRLGYTLAVTVPQRLHRPDRPPTDTQIWRMNRAGWSGSAAEAVQPMTMFDEARQVVQPVAGET